MVFHACHSVAVLNKYPSYKYVSLSDATIGASGQVDVVFLNLSTGPVGCPAG
ncbi:hypothetical protein RF04_002984, partial [Salmonella enterica subsp. houtenae]|nr:hypothetical protein [Salmonella enterica subsp. enterica]EDR0058718.1 hypothetical protein [Salmonella enterica subsp. houtenae]EDR2364381.1 hypothetical protein [Salmonella enterica]EDR6657298.1 hypothetical protein [Salmonella enterica subsp. enterica serovar Michigan]EDR8519914.1 hypothetical protein [Salmonella enterica]